MVEPGPPAASALAARQQALVLCVGLGVVAAGLAAALVTSFMVTADDIEAGRAVLSPPCASHLVFGVDCPTCGLSRAFCALSHGDLDAALQYNRGALVVYGLSWVAGLVSSWGAASSAWSLRARRAEVRR